MHNHQPKQHVSKPNRAQGQQRLTISFLGHDLHDLASADRKFVGLGAAKIVQNLCSWFPLRRRTRRWRRWRGSHGARRRSPCMRGGNGSNGLGNRPWSWRWRRLGGRWLRSRRWWLHSGGLWGGLRQGLACRYRPRSQLRRAAAGASGTKQFSGGDGSRGHLLRSGSLFGNGAGRFSGRGVNRATLVAVHIGSSRVLDNLYSGQLAWFLVVLDAIHWLEEFTLLIWPRLLVANLQVQLSTQGSGKMGKELRLEDTVHERVRLLCTDDNGKPVIFQVRGADRLDGPKWYRSLRRDCQLIVDNGLCYNIYMSTRL